MIKKILFNKWTIKGLIIVLGFASSAFISEVSGVPYYELTTYYFMGTLFTLGKV